MTTPKKLAEATLTVTEIEMVDETLEMATCEDNTRIAIGMAGRIQRVDVYAVAGTHRVGQKLTVTITEPAPLSRENIRANLTGATS